MERTKLLKVYDRINSRSSFFTSSFLSVCAGFYATMLYAEKGVPDFWLTAMKNNDVLSEEVSQTVVILHVFSCLI